jgi:hypothetical protein
MSKVGTDGSLYQDDLLAFQLSHFGDETKPETWFVDQETALTYDPGLEDDGLGYYDDGVKRTLTDDQIEMFRHSELEQLEREERKKTESKDEPPATPQIPYDERHKRKWEQYIEGQDPTHGSMTHRRLARELDEAATTKVDLDY